MIERYETRTREITNSELRTLPPAPPAPLMRTGMQPVARAIERVVSRAAPVADAPWVPPPRETATGPAWAAPARAHVAEPVMLPVLRGFNDRAPAAEAAAPQTMAAAPMERTGLPALAPQLAAALPAMAPSAAPASDSGGGGGAVYLDGLLVGRWMEERLARAAGRPSGGATGFDPRMGPSWPGALQGG
ncbi:MAG: hypothetical protein NT133_15415 [Alphaproteobacteria bacterium]|nr:hypothetical protein [Alphaproteobacteria bacterium]